MAPSLNFSVSTTSVSLGNLILGGTPGSATVGLTVGTNAHNGYTVAIRSNGDLNTGGHIIPGFNGAAANSTDAYLSGDSGDSGLGFSSDDSLVNGANIYRAATCPRGSAKTGPGCFGAITTDNKFVIDHEGPITTLVSDQAWNVYLQLKVPDGKPAGVYSAATQLTALASF